MHTYLPYEIPSLVLNNFKNYKSKILKAVLKGIAKFINFIEKQANSYDKAYYK